MEAVIAKVGSIALAQYGILVYLAWGLNIEFLRVSEDWLSFY